MNNAIRIIFILFIIVNYSFSKNLEKVTLALQWLDQFQFAGFYMAKEKGFYKNVGLDVTFVKYKKNLNIVKNVTDNKLTFGTGKNSLLIYKNNNYPIVVLSAIFQHSPSALLVTNENILTPGDLINKKIMVSTNAITSASYMAMLFSEGVNINDIKIIDQSFNINDLIEKKVDAIASYMSNEPYFLNEKKIPYKYFSPKDYGFDFYGDLLFTSKYQLQNHPQKVEDFTKASLEGWEYAFKHIRETALIIYKKYNIQKKTLEQIVYEGEILKQYAYDVNKELGHVDEKKFNDIAKTYRVLGILKKDYSLDGFIHCVKCNIKNNLNLTKEEKKWLYKNKTIKVATHKGAEPIEFINEKGEYSGISSGYLKLLEKKLNIKFEPVVNDYWFEMIKKMKKKEIDMFSAIVKTPNREQYMNFTSSYLKFPTVIVTKDHHPYITNLSQLSYKTVAVEKGFYTEELLKKLYPDIKLLRVNTSQEAIKKVFKNNAFAYIGTLPNIGHIIKKSMYTNLKINGEAPFYTNIRFSTRSDLKILNSILNKALNSITKEEHDKIYNDWINVKYAYSMEVDYKKIIIFVLLIIIVFIFLYYKNETLKNELKLKERFTNKLSNLNKILELKNQKLKFISESDTLTKIANRRKLDKVLEIEINRTKRNNLDLSIILIDIDLFKNINDSFGHKIGDVVLVELSTLLKTNLRKYDFIGRWGGEEFLIICPQSDLEQTIHLAIKLNNLVRNYDFQSLIDNNLTISCGIAQYKDKMSIDTLIIKADKQLYLAKESGRDQVFPKLT